MTADALFPVAVGTLFAGAGGALFLGRRARQRWLRVGLPIAAMLAILGDGVAIYGRWLEPRWLEVTTTRIDWPGPRLRVVALGDFHAGRTSRARLRRAVEAARAARPDLILLAGDYVSSYSLDDEKLAMLEELRSLAAPLGVYAVLGNHDTEVPGDPPRAEPIRRLLEGMGFTVLRSASRVVADGVVVVGLEEYGRGKVDLERAFAGVPEDAARLVVTHNWRALTKPPRQRWHVAVAGHTHGGQICLPGTRLCPFADKAQPYLRGLHRFDEGWLYVTRGVGESGVLARIGARPEVTILELE